jgi:ornithine decarboxylase
VGITIMNITRRLAFGGRPDSLIARLTLGRRPDRPMLCLNARDAARQARRFVAAFAGDVLYAVKCNPDEAVLAALHDGGIRHFDCASIAEVRLVRRLFPDAGIHFMHPVKARSAINEAYAEHAVRDFVLDSEDELAKILDETGGAADLGLVVRLALAKGNARLDLSGKFGAAPEVAVELLRACAKRGARVGLSFHVGSQCLEPAAWTRALAQAAQVVRDAGVELDILDVGGGFPVAYPDMTPPELDAFMAAIAWGVADVPQAPGCRLWCEPGRALVASCQSLVVRVLARRADQLYLNDGVYGTLSDAGALGFRYPCKMIAAQGRDSTQPLRPFGLFGPTCDSLDRMTGPFLLPADIAEGDWIVIGQIGAYGACLRTGFNGFDDLIRVSLDDRPVPRLAITTRPNRRAA